jgi:hypothetical protein
MVIATTHLAVAARCAPVHRRERFPVRIFHSISVAFVVAAGRRVANIPEWVIHIPPKRHT